MKQLKIKEVYRDTLTNQFVFIHGITGQKTYGTDWNYERALKGKSNTLETRAYNKDTNTINNTCNNNSNCRGNNIIVDKAKQTS